MSEYWSKRLRGCFNQALAESAKPRQVRFPADPGLIFGGSGSAATMHLSGTAVAGNMQTNVAAFESWALALHRWCGASVTISWDDPEFAEDPRQAHTQRGHYQRFLYRMANFSELFSGDWLTVVDHPGRLALRETASSTPLYVNRAGAKEKVRPEHNPDFGRWSEDQWECHLAHAEVRWLDEQFGPFDKKVQQFPVGLFSEPKPSEASRIFPGAKSAVDIVAQTSSSIWIFELKKSGNLGFGALSELLFYTWVVRDLAVGKFKQAGSAAGSSRDFDLTVVDGRQSIQSVLLAPDVHPLVDTGLLAVLNSALTSTMPKVEFSTFEFKPEVWSQVSRL